MKSFFQPVIKLTQAQVDAGDGDSLSGVRIAVVDTNNQPTGKVYESGPSGQAPTEAVTGDNINTVLASAGGAGWEKAQATTASYAIVRPASGASLDVHIETGGTLAALTIANWPIPASGVDQLRIRNMSASAQSFTATGFSGIVTADGNQSTSGSYSIPVDMAVHITIDEDGWIQVAPMGQEVSQAEFDAHTDSTSNPHSVTKTQVGLGNVDNTSDLLKPISTAQQTALDGKSAGIANNNLTDNTFTILSTGKYKINQTLNFGGSGSPTTVSVKVKVNGTAISTTSTTTTGGATNNTYSADRDLSAGDIVSFTTQPTNASQKIDSKTASIQDINGTKTLSSMASTTVQLLAASEEVADYLTGSSNIIASPVAATTTAAGLMSSTDKTKLDGVATGAEVNVQADWNQATTTADDFVKNKPTIPAATVINNTLTSTSTTEALSAAQGKVLQDGKQGTSEKGVANGYAGLNASGIIPSAQMPSLATTTVTSIAPILGANIGLPGYRRSKLIPVTSTTTGSGDYQVELAIGESALSVGATFHLAGNSQDFPTAHKDSGEFAFVKPDGTAIPFWVAEVTGTAPNRTARVYLRMAGLTGQATSVQSLVFMLYDNNLMTIPSQMSVITNVFNLLADDWDGASLDLAKWVATGTVPTQTGSILTFDTANTAKIVNSITTFGDGMEILHRTTFVDDSQSTSRSGFIDNTTAANDFAFGDVWSSAKSLWVGATQSALATEPNATSRLYRLSRLAGNGSFKFTSTDTVIEATRTSVAAVATPIRPWNAYGNTRGDSDWIAVRQILAVPPTLGAVSDV